MSDELRHDFTVLGRVIGQGTGWDQLCSDDFMIFGFVPNEKYSSIPAGDLAVLYEKGKFATYDDAGNETAVLDIVEVLSSVKE